MSLLIEPYGGELRSLIDIDLDREELKHYAAGLPRLQLSLRNICDLEMISVGGFSPLDRFMGEADFESTLENMRLANGTLFPLPVTLSIGTDFEVRPGEDIALADQNNNLLAVMTVEEIYEPDRDRQALLAYGTTNARHPIVAEMHTWGTRNISGPLKVLSLPNHHDFLALRMTPTETREQLVQKGNSNVVAFQTRNPIHRVHEEMTKRAMDEIKGSLLLHPVVGMTKPGDIDHFTRVRSYKALIDHHYDPQRTVLSLLPLAMRMAGPKEALLHAIIRRNYGANHFIVGRDHASPGKDSNGKPFYGEFDAHDLLEKHSEELGVTPVFFEEMVFLAEEDRYEERSKTVGKKVLSLSGTQVREDYLYKGRPLPSWFTRPEVAEILQQAHPPRNKQGFCIWFTGLSGSGKSTTAQNLITRMFEYGRPATLLDGDVVRTHLSKGLGFSKEDRDTNIRRIGFVASEIVRHGGAVICAAVSPYRSTRNECRAMVGDDKFIEVFVDTPLEICEERDVKGMYELARKGKIKNFTGIDDPYEEPVNPEVTIDTVNDTASLNAKKILSYLISSGFVVEISEKGDSNAASDSGSPIVALNAEERSAQQGS
ncbi:MAG: bifunctional sulfate adenylyltransferase/adenylylsulfate kinase [Acidobacteria bacterium]|nr:MAG: bifunctional sulfate adenylyltransferase/adenylylsulfate kinase [Acidobacteriota bacterium]REJ99087.1 MAG: bifunctional sulfate adenylyltransferase/adenylylsulfate kinase [Acidobacteriota bacterium]REK16193.1 MAG: bifunctional sulfate adenylyltransferase/adenylylsulfate kinase [Acidobacteriota bacterium]REK43874.1 MAG: bifunctional sulfate adenylyltransferase/adenylylsulfate kinase [Acidobacteriota bacterium]